MKPQHSNSALESVITIVVVVEVVVRLFAALINYPGINWSIGFVVLCCFCGEKALDECGSDAVVIVVVVVVFHGDCVSDGW